MDFPSGGRVCEQARSATRFLATDSSCCRINSGCNCNSMQISGGIATTISFVIYFDLVVVEVSFMINYNYLIFL